MNKIWNASKFVLMNAENVSVKPLADCKLTAADKWIISKLNHVVREVTVNMEKYELGLASAALYDFVWSDFCDWYIELTKPVLYGEDDRKRADTVSVLVYVLENTLKLLHPFVPFITEEIYRNLPGAKGSIMVSDFPRYNAKLNYAKAKKDMEPVMSVIRAVRNIKVQVGAAPSKKVHLYVKSELKNAIAGGTAYICKLAGVEAISFIGGKAELTEKTVSFVGEGFELYIPLGELVDTEKEIARLSNELLKTEEEIKRASAKLMNSGFLEKAPKHLVDAEREKLNRHLDIRKKLMAEIEELK